MQILATTISYVRFARRRLQLIASSYQYLSCHIISKKQFWLENIYITSSFDESLAAFNWHQQYCPSYEQYIAIISKAIIQRYISSFFINRIERRGHFPVRPSRILLEVHISIDDRCCSNLTNIKQVPMYTWNTYYELCFRNCWILYCVEHLVFKVNPALHYQLHQKPW